MKKLFDRLVLNAFGAFIGCSITLFWQTSGQALTLFSAMTVALTIMDYIRPSAQG